jgi:hypothetical protein
MVPVRPARPARSLVAALLAARTACGVVTGAPVASVRRDVRAMAEDYPWISVGADVLAGAVPWRTFRWHSGQKHYSGTFWSCTQRDHVIYESRLELGVLLLADFDLSVRGILAQPFLLRAEVGGVVRRHVPDYFLMTDSGPVVVDVKPRRRLDRPEVAATFGWTRALVEGRGWRYDVRCEPLSVRLENVRFLAGYRRDWLFDPALVKELRRADLHGASLSTASAARPGWPGPMVRAAVLHLLWAGHFITDLDRQLSGSHVLATAR